MKSHQNAAIQWQRNVAPEMMIVSKVLAGRRHDEVCPGGGGGTTQHVASRASVVWFRAVALASVASVSKSTSLAAAAAAAAVAASLW